jgi:hypothetical protein
VNKCPAQLPTQQQQQPPRQQIKVKKKRIRKTYLRNLLVTSIPGELLLAGVLGSMSLRSDEKFKGVKKSGEKTRLREINDGGVLFGWKKSTRSKTVKKGGKEKRPK